MPVQISGNNIVVPGQALISGPPTSVEHAFRLGDAVFRRAIGRDFDMNAAAPTDVGTITIPTGKWEPWACLACNSTANLSIAQIGVYTAAGGGGVNLVALTVLASLTGANMSQVLAIATPGQLTATTLYVRLNTAAGVAGTIDMVFVCVELADL
jgi:hypothetical protein